MSVRRLMALGCVLIVLIGCRTAQSAGVPPHRSDLPADLSEALQNEYGNFAEMVTWDALLSKLQTADIVCIGEAHYDARDMETAFEITRELAKHQKIALALERFSYDLQPALYHLNALDNDEIVPKEVDAILQNESYQTVWGTHFSDQFGYPVNTPSQASFEAMVKWAAQTGVPLIGLDVSLEDRQSGVGENAKYRQQLWKSQIENFLARTPREKYLVVVIAGINHISNEPDSFPTGMKINSTRKIISIGQRDAMYHYLSSMKVQKVAQAHALTNLVVQAPQFALMNVKGIPIFVQPPDYWIAMHSPDAKSNAAAGN